MAGIRELLAVVLGAALGLAMILAPRAALQLSIFVGPNRRRRGEYTVSGTALSCWEDMVQWRRACALHRSAGADKHDRNQS
ncbi:hypothetical protein, partial [Halobacterium sp. CBA1126]|uniref:hypothetical protein n=1 Tax=Halobacterium sp. CBA1126 TaxID=2668074 RepID=UPI0012FA80CB